MKKITILTLGFAYLFGSTTIFADPPGLAGKGGAEFPRGLEVQEKIPHGWNEGKKSGWLKDHHHKKNHTKHHIDRDNDLDR